MKIFTGKVIKIAGTKTATVAVSRIVIHRLYQKRVKRISKYHVHDEIGVAVGDLVKFITCKPISKTKKWKILKKVNPKKEEK
jgi:small subunit ribosomal protein S17